jgi:hypothetical protein
VEAWRGCFCCCFRQARTGRALKNTGDAETRKRKSRGREREASEDEGGMILGQRGERRRKRCFVACLTFFCQVGDATDMWGDSVSRVGGVVWMDGEVDDGPVPLFYLE